MRITAWTPDLSLLQNLSVSSIERRLAIITSSTERLASYPVTSTAAQNKDNGDLGIISPSAVPGAAIMNSLESIGFGRGRQSLNHSVWYNGALMTFLATAEDTHGQFALIEAVGRRGNVPPPHIHHREDEIFYLLEGEIIFSVSGRTIKGTPGTMIFLPRDVRHEFTIESEQYRMLMLITPAGFEGWFKEFSVPAPAMTLPPANEPTYDEVQKMLEAAPRYGLEFFLP